VSARANREAAAERTPTGGVTVSAVVVTWNRAERLLGLLESLAAQDVDLELVQIENASGDSSLDREPSLCRLNTALRAG
jgi:GT2 family glycosyltransferase